MILGTTSQKSIDAYCKKKYNIIGDSRNYIDLPPLVLFGLDEKPSEPYMNYQDTLISALISDFLRDNNLIIFEFNKTGEFQLRGMQLKGYLYKTSDEISSYKTKLYGIREEEKPFTENFLYSEFGIIPNIERFERIYAVSNIKHQETIQKRLDIHKIEYMYLKIKTRDK